MDKRKFFFCPFIFLSDLYNEDMKTTPAIQRWRHRLHTVIFEADTKAGKLFDEALIAVILLSVAVIMLESMADIREEWSFELRFLEWSFTVFFTIEYILRIICIERPHRFMLSFYGVIDLLSILPTLLSAFIPGVQYLSSIRVMRVMRIFRILKLIKYVGEADLLMKAIAASKNKIIVFLMSILILVTILGSVMYLVDGEENGFTSIPKSIYWAIVTLTTVGYGDIVPRSHLGQVINSFVMIGGYGILAVPTGIVTVEMSKAFKQVHLTRSCFSCGKEGHDDDAHHCKYCGHLLEPESL
jgi:voltage-gated potassium channel